MKTVMRWSPKGWKELVAGLRHAHRFIQGTEHDDSCESLNGPGHMCDCGKVLAAEQVRAAVKALSGKP